MNYDHINRPFSRSEEWFANEAWLATTARSSVCDSKSTIADRSSGKHERRPGAFVFSNSLSKNWINAQFA
jgi:hypothetical protein